MADTIAVQLVLPAFFLRSVGRSEVVLQHHGCIRPLPSPGDPALNRLRDSAADSPVFPPQLCCLLLPDPVPQRFHWPRFSDLRVNSMSYRPYGRQANVKIGNNIRDEPANIGACEHAHCQELLTFDCHLFVSRMTWCSLP